MRAEDVTEIVSGLLAEGITIWPDGGWCVDALVGRQTRPHADLDIAVARADENRLRRWFTAGGYVELPRPGETPANFVLGDASGRQVDVHVFEFTEDGRLCYGVAYPKESLTGHAKLNGVPVRCVAAEYMFRFKTAYPPAPKDIADVRVLHEEFGFAIPPSHTG
jgi:lincosamide nucleotidyltransferase A/C/D/E